VAASNKHSVQYELKEHQENGAILNVYQIQYRKSFKNEILGRAIPSVNDCDLVHMKINYESV